MKKIFISYRRQDTPFASGWLCERLKKHYGTDNVFLDVDLHPGENFRDRIRKALDTCDVVLVMIGQNWLGEDTPGRARIFDPEDWVRVEVSTAFTKDVLVIPVLVQRAPIPKEEQLPKDLSELLYITYASLDAGSEFDGHVEKVIEAIEKLRKPATGTSPHVRASEDPLNISTLVIKFLTKYDRWYFNSARIQKWGGNQPGFEALAAFSQKKIRDTLKQLEAEHKVKSKMGKTKSRIYKIA